MRPQHNERDLTGFMDIPTPTVTQQLYAEFYAATSAEVLKTNTCAVCARRQRRVQSGISRVKLVDLPNKHVLRAAPRHPIEEQVAGYLLVPEACTAPTSADLSIIEVEVCRQCLTSLSRHDEKPPKLSLANCLWVGRVP